VTVLSPGPYFGFAGIYVGCMPIFVLIAWHISSTQNSWIPGLAAFVIWLCLSFVIGVLLLAGPMTTGGSRGIDQFWGLALIAIPTAICVALITGYLYNATQDCVYVISAIYCVSITQLVFGCLFLAEVIHIHSILPGMSGTTYLGLAAVIPGGIFFIVASCCVWHHYVRLANKEE
jgi:hypothetical protein